MVDLSIVIVTYKVKDFLAQCISSVYNAVDSLSYEIFVIDNNSQDGTDELFKENRKNCTFIQNTQNVGFSKANNQVLPRCSGTYILLLNPDTVVQEDTFIKMIAFMEAHQEGGAAGCKILNPDGTLQLGCRRSFPTPLSSFYKLSGLLNLFPENKKLGLYNLTYLDPDSIAEVDALSGSFMMIRKEIISRVGVLDEDFFMYGEDLDWCFRIKEQGWKIYYTPSTQIIHFKGESSRDKGFRSLWSFYHAMHIFVRKHYKTRYFLFADWLLTLGIIFKAATDFVLNTIRRMKTVIIDVILINAVLLLAFYIRFDGLGPLPPYQGVITYLLIHGVATIVWGASFKVIYQGESYSPRKSLYGVSAGFFLITSLTFFFREFAYSRLVALYTWAMGTVLICGWRILYRFFIKLFHEKFTRAERTLIIGNEVTSKKVYDKIVSHFHNNYKIVGFIDDNENNLTKSIGDLRVIGTTQRLPQIIREFDIKYILIAPLTIPYEKIVSLVTILQKEGVEIKLVSESFNTIISKPKIERTEDIPIINLD